MKLQRNHAHQTPEDSPPIKAQMPVHAATATGTREKNPLSITPINFETFQQGCEMDRRNLARNKEDQKLWQALKTLSKQDLDIIEISHKPYLENHTNQTKGQNPIECIDISSPFPSEQNPHKLPRAGDLKTVHWQDEEMCPEEKRNQGGILIF